MMAEGVAAEEILIDFPDLEPEDIQACLLFAYPGLNHAVYWGHTKRLGGGLSS
jgi:uncharacterized protein (DUF433 family)